MPATEEGSVSVGNLVTLGFLVLLAACSIALPAVGQRAAAPDPLVAVADADPLELARVVERLGDDAVLARLADDQPVVTRLAAIRGTPWMRSPEAALSRLVELAGGRDSYLAPAAARAMLAITDVLTADDLALREVSPADLAPVRERLETLSRHPSARPDIRHAAGVAGAALAALGE